LPEIAVLAHDRRMSRPSGARLVYSSQSGRICPGCGWPERDCRCSTSLATETVPARIVAKLRLEKKGRGGKSVTVVDGLPRNATFLSALGGELKRACGTGGTVLETGIELQGDLRERVREVLAKKGYVVKG
jgi:translation initiation factor 1